MQIIDLSLNILPEPCVASIGFFDGVHLGHQFLINQVKYEANKRGLKSAVITFPMHPGKVINPTKHIDQLTLADEKFELLEKSGLDYCFLLEFSHNLAQYSAQEFMAKILFATFNVRTLVIGHDHRFGYNRKDGFEQYVEYGKDLGIEVLQAEAFTDEVDGETISSSNIREAIQLGHINLANKQLGYSYFLNGVVVDGKKLGRTIGFPTANIQVSNQDKMVPNDGVYAVKVNIEGDNKCYWGMLNIGLRPTVNNGSNRSIEVNILDFNQDIYRKKIRVIFLKWLRPEIKFDSLDALVDEMKNDEATVRSIMHQEYTCNCK